MRQLTEKLEEKKPKKLEEMASKELDPRNSGDDYSDNESHENKNKPEEEVSGDRSHSSDEAGASDNDEKEGNSEQEGNEVEEEKDSCEEDEKKDDAIQEATIKATSENFKGFKNHWKFLRNRFEDPNENLFECTYKDVEYNNRPSEGDRMEAMIALYIANKKNNEAMRKSLFVSSANFIDHFLANLIINSNYVSFSQLFLETKPSKTSDPKVNSRYPILRVLDIFMLLCCNPLNEIQLFDTILTLLSFDCENEAALAAFNEYFGVKLTPTQLQLNRSKFVEVILFIFLRLYAAVPNKTNGFETNNFDRLVVEAEVIIGPSPLKKRLLPHCPLLETSPKNFLTEFAISVARSGISAQIATKAVNFALTIRNLQTILPIQNEPEEVTQKILDLVEILVTLNPKQPKYINASTAIADLLKGEEVFFNFLDLIYKNSGSLFRTIEMKLQKIVVALKGLTQETSSAWSQLESQIEQLSRDLAFKKLSLILRLIANQAQNFLDDLNQLKGLFKKSDYSFVLRFKEALSKLHVGQRFGNAYLLLVQTFELLGTMINSVSLIQNHFKALKAPLDIALDAYRIFNLQEKITEIFEEQQYLLKNTENSETIQSTITEFAWVATKSDEDYDELASAGFEKSFSSIQQSGVTNIDEVFLLLSQKAKNIIQSVVLEDLMKKPKKDDEEENSAPILDTKKIKANTLLNRFPWILQFEAKKDHLYSQLQEDQKKESSIRNQIIDNMII